jgi:hypothetical protein
VERGGVIDDVVLRFAIRLVVQSFSVLHLNIICDVAVSVGGHRVASDGIHGGENGEVAGVNEIHAVRWPGVDLL